MSWFYNRPKTDIKPAYTGLQLQTAVSTLPIPIFYGQTKGAPNVVYYNNFRTTPQTSNTGKGGSNKTVTGYAYSADIILALCEGPIGGLGYIWRGQSTYTLAGLGLTLFAGTTPQSPWGYLTSKVPSEALSYQGTAYVCAANYDLGSGASLGNHNFEIIGALAGTGVNGIDADPARMIYDFLTNAQYGAGFNPASINLTTLYGSGGEASLQTYCRAMGIALSAALSTPEPASSTLTRWLQLTNCAAVWSGGQLKFIPYGDLPIAAGNLPRVISTPVPVPAQRSDGTYPPPSVLMATAANFVADGGVVYALTGVALTYSGASAPSLAGAYGISPAGTYLFHPADQGAQVTISCTISSPVSYLPNLTPIYALNDLDFVDEHGNKDPVQAHRVDPFSLPTVQRIECLSRNHQYGSAPVEARDQSQIEAFGTRVGATIQAHEICDEAVIGPVVAQTLLQRSLYVRTRFTFKLSWEYCLLDPMDIVTITDANLGLAAYPVRIVSIDENDKGLLSIEAEELVLGVSTPGANPSSGAVSFQPNQGAMSGSINPPLIYEPPPLLTGNAAQVWVGASGGSAGAADPNWGGAFVWASVDNVTFSQIGTITQPLRQGFATAALASASGWDAIDALALNLSESGGVLSGTSIGSAQAGATLSLIDGELISYQNATLTGANAYNVTGLQRGFAGSVAAAHAVGAPFARLDSAVVKYDLPANWIGVALYFKFQSFNVFGAGVQDLSTCAVYNYTPTGASSLGPITLALQIGTSLDFGSVTAPVMQADDWGSVYPGAATVSIDLGAVAG
ncbi:MAG: phage tail protein [Pseudomonadota bacterium]|nr:phage tail protein [Pseudomonadota bacterium]